MATLEDILAFLGSDAAAAMPAAQDLQAYYGKVQAYRQRYGVYSKGCQ